MTTIDIYDEGKIFPFGGNTEDEVINDKFTWVFIVWEYIVYTFIYVLSWIESFFSFNFNSTYFILIILIICIVMFIVFF